MNIHMQEGIVILLVGMGVVFMALVILYLVFQFLVPYSIALGKKKIFTAKTTEAPQSYRTAEEVTAIAAAIYMYLEESHDEENAILTIRKSSKNYSPWSSKIYGTHQLHKR